MEKRKKLQKILKPLREGLEQQEVAYREMLELSQKQQEVLKSDDISGITELVEAKNSVMNKIQEAEEVVVPILKRWKNIKSEFDEETVNEVEEKFKNVQSLLSEIMEHEQALEEYAQKLAKETSKDIKSLIRAQNAQSEYGVSDSSSRGGNEK